MPLHASAPEELQQVDLRLDGAPADLGADLTRCVRGRLHKRDGVKPLRAVVDGTVIFETRWAMSYLRGPLTRPQVRELMAGKRDESTAQLGAVAPVPAGRPVSEPTGVAVARPSTAVGPAGAYVNVPPALPPELTQVFLPLRIGSSGALSKLEQDAGHQVQVSESTVVYEPTLLALGRVDFVDRPRRVSEARQIGLLVRPDALGAIIRWQDADAMQIDQRSLLQQPEPNALFGQIPPQLNALVKLKAAAKDFADYLTREQVLDLFYMPALDLYGQPGESERDFVVRAQQSAREARDAEVEKLRQKYQQRLSRLEDRLTSEQRQLTADKADYEARKREEMLSAAESVVGVLGIFGRRSSTALSKAATKRRLTATARADVSESEADVARMQAQVEEMRQDMQQEADAVGARWTAALDKVQKYSIRPSRGAVQVELVALAWSPYWEIGYLAASGSPTTSRMPAW